MKHHPHTLVSRLAWDSTADTTATEDARREHLIRWQKHIEGVNRCEPPVRYRRETDRVFLRDEERQEFRDSLGVSLVFALVVGAVVVSAAVYFWN